MLANVTDLRIRASLPVQRRLCAEPPPVDPADCTKREDVPNGYVGGYVDEIKLSLN